MKNVRFKQLQQGNVEAWTYLIRENPRLKETTVVRVDLSPAAQWGQRATVFLSTQQDPLVFLLAETSPAAAHFYSDCSGRVSFLLPKVWLAESGKDIERPGIVLEDVEPGLASRLWVLSDLDTLAEQLATLHATFWQPRAADVAWLPFALNQPGLSHPIDLHDPPTDMLFSLSQPLHMRQTMHAYPAFDPEIVKKTRSGWPDLLTDRYLQAVYHLQRDSSLLLRPLLTLPMTVIHGQPSLDRWRMTLFGNSYLLDWRRIAVGPAVLDLDLLLYSIPDEPRPDRAGRLSAWKTASESFLDSYFVALSEALHERHGYGVSYSSRYMRRFALPAARCWLVLNRHLPAVLKNPDKTSGGEVPRLWGDFLDAYRLLTTYVKGMSEIGIKKV